jgi:catechol 2,3-dioxygenase-like lactoylglutathione lyase family enzyme
MGVVSWRRAATVLLALACVLGPPLLPATSGPSVERVRTLEGVALAVADAGRAAEFYARVLFFETVSDQELRGPGSRVRVVRMRLGDEMIELIEDPAAGRSLRRVAIVVNDLDQGYLWLRRHGVRPESPAPRPDWNPQTGGIRTVSFHDPDGHPLALVQFPADLGAARWRRPTDRVFLGIDRSAGDAAKP